MKTLQISLIQSSQPMLSCRMQLQIAFVENITIRELYVMLLHSCRRRVALQLHWISERNCSFGTGAGKRASTQDKFTRNHHKSRFWPRQFPNAAKQCKW